MYDCMTSNSKSEEDKKNFLWRIKEIFRILKEKEDFMYKSALKKVGLDANSAEIYIQVIEFIQKELVDGNQRFVVQRAGRHTVVKLEPRDIKK